MHDLNHSKKNEKLIAPIIMNCYTLFGVFHGHRPAVYINQHLLWALMSVTSGALTQTFGSSRIASPAFFYSFANRQLPSAKCDVRCDRARACGKKKMGRALSHLFYTSHVSSQ